MHEATRVPVETAVAAARVLELCDAATDDARESALGDLSVAAVLAWATLDAASLTARVNLKDAPEAAFAEALDEARRRAEGARARLGWRRRG
jgi:formiminotetrahydrofolate cyclodeaminase